MRCKCPHCSGLCMTLPACSQGQPPHRHKHCHIHSRLGWLDLPASTERAEACAGIFAQQEASPGQGHCQGDVCPARGRRLSAMVQEACYCMPLCACARAGGGKGVVISGTCGRIHLRSKIGAVGRYDCQCRSGTGQTCVHLYAYKQEPPTCVCNARRKGEYTRRGMRSRH